MNFRPIFCALPLALAACGQTAATPAPEPPLAGAGIGGPFALTNQAGKPVTDRDFAGRYRLIYFGYTFCPDVCPVDLQKLMAGYRKLEQTDAQTASKVAPIFVTVDPERDTAPVLKQYVSAFHPKLTGLTGTPEQIAKVAKAYAIFYSKQKKPGATDYLVDHSRVAYLFGPKGEPIALIPHDGTPEQIAAALKRWVT